MDQRGRATDRLDRLTVWLHGWQTGQRGSVFRWFISSVIIFLAYAFLLGGVTADAFCATRVGDLEGRAASAAFNECKTAFTLALLPIALLIICAGLFFALHVATLPFARLARKRRAQRIMGPGRSAPAPEDETLDSWGRWQAAAFADRTSAGMYRYATQYFRALYSATVPLGVAAAVLTFLFFNYVREEILAGELQLEWAFLWASCILFLFAWIPARRLFRQTRDRAVALTKEEDHRLLEGATGKAAPSPTFQRGSTWRVS